MAKDKPKARRPSEVDAERERSERIARAQRMLHMRVEGTDVEFTLPTLENLPIAFRRRIKLLTGDALADLGVDPMHQACCLWWASRLLAGEDVSLAEAEEEWDERCKGTRLDNLVTSLVDGEHPSEGEVDSPEA